MVYSNTTVYGGNQYGQTGHLCILYFFEALINDAFKVQFFSGLHFYILSKTLTAWRASIQLRSLKVKTLLKVLGKSVGG